MSVEETISISLPVPLAPMDAPSADAIKTTPPPVTADVAFVRLPEVLVMFTVAVPALIVPRPVPSVSTTVMALLPPLLI